MTRITSEAPDGRDLEALVEEYLDRLRRGEQPLIAEYAQLHPEFAEQIEQLFPALAVVEVFKPDSHDITGNLSNTFAGPDGSTQFEGQSASARRLGDFRIIREVGRGGMGIVYEAEQESLCRRVALKVLASPSLNDPRQVARFDREARSAARLHHTNIVPIFGVGSESGSHYYVMQFIHGLGLDQVLEEAKRLERPELGGVTADRASRQHQAAADGIAAVDLASALIGSRFATTKAAGSAFGEAIPADFILNLTSVADSGLAAPKTIENSADRVVGAPDHSGLSSVSDSKVQYAHRVAQVGLPVAEALEYAHQQGILHRNIKPSNLLLDAHGTTWVADFGLAKAAADEDLTHSGDIVGTIRYIRRRPTSKWTHPAPGLGLPGDGPPMSGTPRRRAALDRPVQITRHQGTISLVKRRDRPLAEGGGGVDWRIRRSLTRASRHSFPAPSRLTSSSPGRPNEYRVPVLRLGKNAS
jgi:hypothetical protein